MRDEDVTTLVYYSIAAILLLDCVPTSVQDLVYRQPLARCSTSSR